MFHPPQIGLGWLRCVAHYSLILIDWDEMGKKAMILEILKYYNLFNHST